MSSSNCCFLTCIQISQEAGQVVWYSHLFQNFPQFIVIHTLKYGFGIFHKAEIDVFLELSCFFDDPADVGNLISGSSAFSKTSKVKRLYKMAFLEREKKRKREAKEHHHVSDIQEAIQKLILQLYHVNQKWATQVSPSWVFNLQNHDKTKVIIVIS